MRKFIAFVFIICPVLIYAQGPARSGNPEKKGGVVTGKVIEDATSNPVEFANVAIYHLPDSTLITGAITNEKGEFVISGIPSGKYFITANFIGYEKEHLGAIEISSEEKLKAVGTIKLEQAVEQIGEVEVVGEKPYVTYKADRKVVNVSQHVNAAGGTASDVLENVPSVTVDAEGTVSLRGSTSYTVLIDGKPSPITGSDLLKQMPANAIENIEIITNPSAKYDPEGTAGIINLVMKKQTQKAFNGQLTASAGTGDKYNTDFQMNYRTKKFNYFGGINYSYNRFAVDTDINREYYEGIDSTDYLGSSLDQKVQRDAYRINLGIDYDLNDNNSLSLSGNYGGIGMDLGLNNHYHQSYSYNNLNNYFLNDDKTDIGGNYLTSTLNYIHKFKSEGDKLEVTGYYAGWDGTQDQFVDQYTTDVNWLSNGSNPSMQRSNEETDRDELRFNTDYTKMFGEKSKLEAGYQYKQLGIVSNYLMENYNSATSAWELNSIYSNKVDFIRSVHAGYTTFSSEVWGINYQLGIRAEYTFREIDQITLNRNDKIDRFDFFPSVHFTKQLPKNQQLQLSYSRRINRPNQRFLNPNPFYTDGYTEVYGNPGLDPEFVDSYELSYTNRIKQSMITGEIYFRQNNNSIDRIMKVEDGVNIMTFANINKQYYTGVELSANTPITKWWRLYASGSYFNIRLKDDLVEGGDTRDGYSWNARLNTSFIVTPKTRIMLNGFYNGKTINAQGEMEPFFMAGIAVSQDLFKRKASLTLNVRDVLASGRFKMTNEGQDFYVNTKAVPEAQVITLSFTYRINNYQRRSRNDDIDMDLNQGI